MITSTASNVAVAGVGTVITVTIKVADRILNQPYQAPQALQCFMQPVTQQQAPDAMSRVYASFATRSGNLNEAFSYKYCTFTVGAAPQWPDVAGSFIFGVTTQRQDVPSPVVDRYLLPPLVQVGKQLIVSLDR